MMKRIFDIIFAIFAILLLSPLFIVISILNKLTSEGPVFYRHERAGLNGKIFFVYKFRTMVSNADKVGPGLTEKGDPRITPFGNYLRRTSLDEIPQFFNVFKGEMSVVGPRPEIPGIVSGYSKFQQQVLNVKPGITGLPQINGRADLSIPKKLRLDVFYVKHCSLWLDIKIIFKTIYIVIAQKGAF